MFVDTRSETAQTQPFGMELRYTIKAQQSGVTRLQWSPDGSLLAVPCRTGQIGIHDAEDGTPIRRINEAGTSPVLSVSFSPDGRFLASGSSGRENALHIWDVTEGSLVQSLTSHPREVNTVCFSPDGSMLATVSTAEIRLWDTRTWERTNTIQCREVLHAIWLPDGRLASGAADGITLWDPSTGESVAHSTGAEALSLASSRSGHLLVSSGRSNGGKVRLWNPTTLSETHILPHPNGPVLAVAVLEDGAFGSRVLIAAKSRDGSVRLWKRGSWECVATLQEDATHSGWCVGLAFHPNRPLLATLGGYDQHVRVWNLDLDALTSTAWDPDIS